MARPDGRLVACSIIGVLILALIVLTLGFRDDDSDPIFEFRERCDEAGGVIYSYNSGYPPNGIASDDKLQHAGVLLGCQSRANFGDPFTIFFDELSDIQQKIDSGIYAPQNEHDRLSLYFQLVYPSTPDYVWSDMSLPDLVNFYQSMEFYYKLPDAIQPDTPIELKRSAEQRFFRTPGGVVIDQDPDRPGVTTPFIEVIHWGNNNSQLAAPQTLYAGTYYYPVRGSGLFLPLGQCLTAFNKVHALKQLGIPNEWILQYCGFYFIHFVRIDSFGWWAEFVKSPQNTKGYQLGDRPDEFWRRTCTLNKNGLRSSQSCRAKPLLSPAGAEETAETAFGMYKSSLTYIPEALDGVIEDMVKGKCVREGFKTVDGKKVKRRIYYGGGDTLDRYMAQQATAAGFDTIQLLREAQLSVTSNAIHGTEFIDLRDAIASQQRILRLDPFQRPHTLPDTIVNKLRYEVKVPMQDQMMSMTIVEPYDHGKIFTEVQARTRNLEYWDRA